MRRLAAAALLLVAGAALGQGYPSRPVTLVNGFPPGAATDTVSRQIAAVLTRRLGQSVVVENRTGASGTIGAASVARAAPDGYTLLFGVLSNLIIGPASIKDITFDPVQSFAPVIEVARGPYVLVVVPSVPAKTLPEFIDYAKKNPGKLNFGSVGPGSAHHFAGEMLKRAAGIEMVHVPYKGGGPAYAGLLGGEIQVLLDTMPGPQPYVQAGTLRALGVAGPKRLSTLPTVPTFAEQGLDGVDVQFMFGVVAPRGTPADIVAKLNSEITQVLADPEVRATLAKQSIEPSPGTPEAFGALIATEFRRWKEIVAKTGFKAN
jgi:tripartite-type tricarboxylate transporter receptor subunit TctC